MKSCDDLGRAVFCGLDDLCTGMTRSGESVAEFVNRSHSVTGVPERHVSLCSPLT